MKKFTLLFLMFFSCMAYSQVEIDSLWKEQINTVFKGLDKTLIPKGVLLDYAMEFTNVPAYNGKITDSTAVDIDVFGEIYKTLYMGLTVPDSTYFPQMKNVARNWVNHRIHANTTTQNTIVLSGLLYEYSRISPNALQEDKIVAKENSGYSDKYINGVWQNPYETLTTVAFAPPVRSYNQRKFKVLLPKKMMLGNVVGNIKKIEVDFGDNTGFHPVTYDTPINVNYSGEGTYKWIFKISMADASLLYTFTHFTIKGGNGNGVTTRNDVAGARMRIDYATGHTGIVKPLIVAEGFDPGSILEPENDEGDSSYADFRSSILSSFNLRSLLDQQYDIIYIDWKNGTDDLKNNSVVLENVINWVNNNKQGNEKLVLLGQSMGGVIGRYTLARMESQNKTHNVRLFISHDAPQQGSNTPISAQHFSRHMYNEYAQTPLATWGESVIIPIFMFLSDTMADIINNQYGTNLSVGDFASPQDALTIQDTPAAVQMNYEWVTFGENITRAIHDQWQEELENMGYPSQSRNIAISNGNECGQGHGFEPGDMLVTMHKQGSKSFWRQLLWSVATPLIGLGLDDVELIFLGLLPGSSRYYFDFDIKSSPAPTDTDRHVYYGRIRYKKKFMWLIPITHTITERSKNAPATSLPYDTYAGGSFDISNVTENIPDLFPDVDLINPRYGFIPVVSSLDIKRNNNDVLPADYLKVYGLGSTPETALTSGFNNFLVENRTDAPFNGTHITFRERTGSWLVNELNQAATHSVISCSYQCDTEIKGPESFCSNAAYSVGAGATSYLWTVVNGSNIATIPPGGNTGKTATVVTIGPGQGWITLSVTYGGPCGNVTATKQIYIGSAIPKLAPISCSDYSNAANECMAFTALPLNTPVPLSISGPGVTGTSDNYEWLKVSGNFIFVSSFYPQYSNAQNMGTKATGNYGVIFRNGPGMEMVFQARVKNGCGWGPWKTFHITNTMSSMTVFSEDEELNSLSVKDSDMYYIYPNPSHDILNISLLDENYAPQNGAEISAELYNLSNVLLRTVKISGATATINVQGIPPGIYVLRINVNGTIESHQVAIN